MERAAIVLIGPTGTGKSTLGKRLAKRLGIAQVSFDQQRWRHPLVRQMQRRFSEQAGGDRLRDAARVLLDLALLLEGTDITDRVAFSRASLELLGYAV